MIYMLPFEQQYPNLCRKAGSHVIHNANMDLMQYEGQVSPESLTGDLTKAVKASLKSVEF